MQTNRPSITTYSPEIRGMTGPNIVRIDSGSEEKKQCSSQKNRCGVCSKKTGLTGFQCRCGVIYCGLHRYPEEHACKHDYKAHERSILEKNLIVGKLSEKLEKL